MITQACLIGAAEVTVGVVLPPPPPPPPPPLPLSGALVSKLLTPVSTATASVEVEESTVPSSVSPPSAGSVAWRDAEAAAQSR